ncbi:WhiB family transcriptional regulator [Nocardia thailandica]|uniref:Transcriptional regulator WhiB n=1 Tax=Nocardia thailandica TaxID=257275 RepID=A0ABW6PL51_9NOCA|nr:WhiB family transcriptional regulator [Nocardia thailandica]
MTCRTTVAPTPRAREITKVLPCRAGNPDLWFAESPRELEEAKALCAACPIRSRCLDAAIDRREPWGVWGGEIFDQGVVIARKRPRGRPRKVAIPA